MPTNMNIHFRRRGCAYLWDTYTVSFVHSCLIPMGRWNPNLTHLTMGLIDWQAPDLAIIRKLNGAGVTSAQRTKIHAIRQAGCPKRDIPGPSPETFTNPADNRRAGQPPKVCVFIYISGDVSLTVCTPSVTYLPDFWLTSCSNVSLYLVSLCVFMEQHIQLIASSPSVS